MTVNSKGTRLRGSRKAPCAESTLRFNDLIQAAPGDRSPGSASGPGLIKFAS